MSSEEAKKEQRTKRKYFGVVTTIFNLQKAIFNLKVSWLCESVCVCVAHDGTKMAQKLILMP